MDVSIILRSRLFRCRREPNASRHGSRRGPFGLQPDRVQQLFRARKVLLERIHRHPRASWRVRDGPMLPETRLMSAVADADDALTPNAIEQYVSRLRTKLGGAADIRAVRGMGYRLDERAG